MEIYYYYDKKVSRFTSFDHKFIIDNFYNNNLTEEERKECSRFNLWLIDTDISLSNHYENIKCQKLEKKKGLKTFMYQIFL